MGADDYVTKPFSMKALMARVGALLRRVDAATDDDGGSRITCGPVTMDADRFEVLADGAPVTLTPTEFKLLKALISAGGRLRTRDRLIDEAVGIDVAVVDRTIDVHIASLRKKLGAHAGWIQTIRGAGYVWRPPVADDD
jgi:two-component system phosphate regulon response regulator PhoB